MNNSLYTKPMYIVPPSINVDIGQATILSGEHASETYIFCQDVTCRGDFPEDLDTEGMAKDIKEAIVEIIKKYQTRD